MSGEFIERFVTLVGPRLFRLIWWNHIDPGKRDTFTQDFEDLWLDVIVGAYEQEKGRVSEVERTMMRTVVTKMLDARFGDFTAIMPQFTDVTFEKVTSRIVEGRATSQLYEILAAQLDVWTSHITNLNEALISSVDRINAEYLIWLKTHPDQLGRIHWQAFEALIGEILASHRLEVRLTGRVRGQSADILAIESNELGIATKYLVECKHYQRKIGLSIVNAVLGSKALHDVDHAILVTTSEFTRDVVKIRAQLEEKRLHLRDGAKIKEWLADYRLSDTGVWLLEGWDLDRDK